MYIYIYMYVPSQTPTNHHFWLSWPVPRLVDVAPQLIYVWMRLLSIWPVPPLLGTVVAICGNVCWNISMEREKMVWPGDCWLFYQLFFHNLSFPHFHKPKQNVCCIFCLGGWPVSVKLEVGAEWDPPVQAWQHSAYGARLPQFVPYAPLLETAVADGLQFTFHSQWACWWHSRWGKTYSEIMIHDVLMYFG